MTEVKQSLLPLKTPRTFLRFQIQLIKKMLLFTKKQKTRSFNFKRCFCEEQAFSPLLPKSKFGYNTPRDISVSAVRYFNQRFLNFNHFFASDIDYIFFARSMYKQRNLCSSINFAMHKIQPRTLTAGMVKNLLTRAVERSIANDNAFSFMRLAKATPTY